MYQIHRYVKVIASGATGRVEERRDGSGRYFVEFDRDPSTRQWFSESELVGVSSALFFLRLHSNKLFYIAGRCIAPLLPEQFWYPAVLRISLLQALLLRPLIALSPYRKDPRRYIIVSWLLNSWLRQLSNLRRPFPIPIRTKGEEAIIDARGKPYGVMICSVHLPLVHLILRSLAVMNCAPDAVVAGQKEMRNQRIPLWGLEGELPGIVPGPHVLLRVQRELRRGGAVFALVDTDLGDSIRPNIFRLVRIAGARAVFAIPELLPNGEILVKFSVPPDPFCLSDPSIFANIQALHVHLERIFQVPSKHPATPVRHADRG
jgi:hypothetical protein